MRAYPFLLLAATALAQTRVDLVAPLIGTSKSGQTYPAASVRFGAGAAWKTQQRVRALMEAEYATGPDGLSGNDDCGQMSAWYVLSTLGFYPVCPGRPTYQIGSPVFELEFHMGPRPSQWSR